jgi:hypothetical protein
MLRLEASDLQIDKASLLLKERLSFLVQTATARSAPQSHSLSSRVERLDAFRKFADMLIHLRAPAQIGRAYALLRKAMKANFS